MKGKYHIVVQNNRLRYELDVKRNITIIRGDSATGKTTLLNMIQSAYEMGADSGVEINCECSCRTITGSDWKLILPELHKQIIFLDEENRFIKSQEFAEAVKKSDNYFVIITREDLPNLPYSVDEIYGIHTSGKYHDTKKVYNEMYRLYGLGEISVPIKPELVITEDSNAGYDFFKAVCCEKEIICKSAGGKSNLVKLVDNVTGEITVIIADGAAIGSEMNELYQLMNCRKNIICYLPESFEWLILKSGLLNNRKVRNILEQPENYADSSQYFSWERFFTAVLITGTQGTYLHYSKSNLNKSYLSEKNKSAILKEIEGIEF